MGAGQTAGTAELPARDSEVLRYPILIFPLSGYPTRPQGQASISIEMMRKSKV